MALAEVGRGCPFFEEAVSPIHSNPHHCLLPPRPIRESVAFYLALQGLLLAYIMWSPGVSGKRSQSGRPGQSRKGGKALLGGETGGVCWKCTQLNLEIT